MPGKKTDKRLKIALDWEAAATKVVKADPTNIPARKTAIRRTSKKAAPKR
jgi:hypothetical protein